MRNMKPNDVLFKDKKYKLFLGMVRILLSVWRVFCVISKLKWGMSNIKHLGYHMTITVKIKNTREREGFGTF